MSFRDYLNWKHYALITIWPLLTFISNAGTYGSIAEVAGVLIAGPVIILAGIYVYYSVKHKTDAKPSDS
jgi:hypothetical protein